MIKAEVELNPQLGNRIVIFQIVVVFLCYNASNSALPDKMDSSVCCFSA